MMHAHAALKTKLRPPLLGNDTITRDRLLSRLGYHRPVTLVVAPPGYGKTTLVVDWLERTHYPSAWLSLDRNDDSLPAFMSYLLAALQTLYPDACPETRALLNSSSPPPPSALAHTLVNELEAVHDRFALVLDDYHLIQDLAVHQVMEDILHYQPRTLEVVLIARHDPPLPLPALRARNRLTEIRAQDLCFLPEEAREFLHYRNNLPLEDSQIEALDTMTEGWAAGLRMAVLLLQQQSDMFDVSLNSPGSGRFAMEYLLNEVFLQLPTGLQEFLLKTALLEQVCAPLCAAVIGGEMRAEECQVYLDTLAQNNLFVFPLFGEGAWYRYHHLFAIALQHRAGQALFAGEYVTLHARASNWLAAHGQIDGAIVHAVKSADAQAVADLVRRHRHGVIGRGNWARLETWRRLIPREMVTQHPQLLILDAWSFSHRAAIGELAQCLDAIDLLLEASPLPAHEETLLRSELDAMRAQAVYWSGDVDACLMHSERALAAAPIDYAYARMLAYLGYVTSLEMAGESEAASQGLATVQRESLQQQGTIFPAMALVAAGHVNWMRADMTRLDESMNRMLGLGLERNDGDSISLARYFRGAARYQENDLAGAEQDFGAVIEMPYGAHPFAYLNSILGQASVYQAQGEFDKAQSTVVQGYRHAQASGNAMMMARAEGFHAHLNFRQGRMDEALRWLARPSMLSPATPMTTFHVAPIGRAAVLLGEGSAEARSEAADLLAALRASTERMHNTRFRIEVLALQALALAGAGGQEAALDLLEQAVQLTIPGEALRALADLDFLVGPLLEQLAKRSPARVQITRIRRAALVYRPAFTPQPSAPQALEPQHPAWRHPDLLESMTHREMDVLVLLLERPSNKEIAAQLSISTETVKRHLVNIFRKLHVDNRRQAIVQARLMGILPRT